jgi:hypothetical protein
MCLYFINLPKVVVLNAILLFIILLIVILLNVVFPRVIMINVVLLSDVLQIVVLPCVILSFGLNASLSTVSFQFPFNLSFQRLHFTSKL